MKHIIVLTALLSLFGAVAFAGTPTNSCGCPAPSSSTQPFEDLSLQP